VTWRRSSIEQPGPLLCRRRRGHAAILVENARRKAGPEAGGGHRRVELSNVAAEIQGPDLDLVALSEAVDKLQAKDPRAAAWSSCDSSPD